MAYDVIAEAIVMYWIKFLCWVVLFVLYTVTHMSTMTFNKVADIWYIYTNCEIYVKVRSF